MDHRTNESTMEWEYNGQGPMDPQSPFSTFTNQSLNSFPRGSSSNLAAGTSAFGTSPDKPLPSLPHMGSRRPNPFASTPRAGAGISSPAKDASIFDRSFQSTHRAAPFLNPSFTTPRKPFDEAGFSEMSGAESSPAATDADISEMPLDSPDLDGPRNRMDLDGMNISPSRGAQGFLHGKSPAIPTRASGKGGIPRGKFGYVDKIRKRKRHNEDRDVGTVRHRIESEISESDSADDDTDVASRAATRGKRVSSSRGSRKAPKHGWLGGFLSAVTKNPTAPEVLSRWANFFIQTMVTLIVVYFLYSVVLSIRHDMQLAAEQARSERLGNITQCATNYHENRCFPREKRLPRLMEDCDEWEICMNQDADDIQTIAVGVKQFAELLNEFVSTMHYKTIGVLGGLVFLFMFASRTGSSNPQAPNRAVVRKDKPKMAVGGFQVGNGGAGDPHRGFILTPAPINFHVPSALDEGTDTDASPEAYRSIMPPPETPSRRRSPSKDKRRASPVKILRSPTKGY